MEFEEQQQMQGMDLQNVQSHEGDQGNLEGEQPQQQEQQPIDYEKSFRNLEKDYTRKAQKLKELEAWEKFQEQTGISAEQALQQLEYYQGQQPQHQQPHDMYGSLPAQNFQQVNYPQTYDDPRVTQLEQQLQELKQMQQIDNLRKRFPQFDEMYPDVMNLAQSQGLDVETAFGRLMVDRWDDVRANTEKQVVEKIRAKGLKALEPSGTPEPPGEGANLSQEELAAANMLGVSPEDYAQMKNVKYTID
ncbi:hypothetical protein DCC39_10225 [Pueribacillus theae]|uniref:Uncharacterized protein n=1 Tax=Pueribacillus theae TaxID=2171751 RepID=A0A2U1K1E1_9BACI|nr:hypothetical protein [Pueribacillus theae]PWA11065.1 hypothetical protein DCC39_10225 [Pueribacillus theae]